MPSPAAQQYRIGLVSRLSGLPVATIRMWERRYDVVRPARSPGGARLYSEQDVTKLSLLRRAGEQGHSIGTLVGLDVEELRARLAMQGQEPAPRGACRIAVIGEGLAARMLEACSGFTAIELVGAFADPAEALSRLGLQGADIVLADCPSLQPTEACQLLDLLSAVRPRMLMVVYGFSSQRTLRSLDQDRVLIFRAPVEPAQLVRASLIGLNVPLPCLARERRQAAGQEGALAATPRRFSDAQLARLSELASAVRCECPRHLSDLLSNLHAFERYSAQCADAGPEDAALHRMLQLSTAHARMLLEEALGDMLRAEQIDPDALSAG